MKRIYYLIALVIVGLDQLVKWLIVSKMTFGESIELIPGVFSLTSHRNQGAAWGILQGRMWFFYLITAAVIAFLVYYMERYAKESKWLGVGLGLTLGGAIGNFIDRLFRKEVVDFLHATFIDFPIFNIADMSLTFGVIFLMIYVLMDERKKRV